MTADLARAVEGLIVRRLVCDLRDQSIPKQNGSNHQYIHVFRLDQGQGCVLRVLAGDSRQSRFPDPFILAKRGLNQKICAFLRA